ncbi:MAG: response regulator [Pseudodesulfovibrio sp.]|uniref:histidine kinase n=2 Tax=Desulfovibrionaceae TaxID=194924 RepID=E6VYS9_PSEA9|nr:MULTISPECIES: ATP-binding protein [Pseudodesulfovibrio]ADU63946.1 ATP-binding region ATPase domain protein [Pseudodesulfovibrio aespoeensis Aspo-2]MBU4192555.1 response regulator [Pseudomonadota bacterium]MBU4243397.1 response regulator [Pseudomonadota bacterium]MBU4379282.1 response regulator [Pseudomonadota bacterium]MBU4474384.1 response regulator [Pseudomonadota bacterium]
MTNPRSLSRRVTLVQTAVITAVVLLFSTATISWNAYRLTRQLDDRIAQTLKLAETTLSTAVWQLDHDAARDILDAVFMDEAVVFAQVVAGQETVAEKTRPPFSRLNADEVGNPPCCLSRTTVIKKYGEPIGSFNLVVSKAPVRRDILVNAGSTLALALALILILVITQATLHFARKRLIIPLQRLEASATAIAEGNLDIPVDTSPDCELRNLTRAFEDMRESMRHLIKDLQTANAKLEDHRAHLETTVRERTEELEHKNDSLNTALDELRNATLVAERANLAKSRFLSSMSHEIRTPMNAVLGMAEILGETELTPDQTRYVQIIRAAGESLLAILSDIIDLSRIETGSLRLDETRFTLSETVDKAFAIIEPRAGQKSLELVCTLAPDVPNRLTGDPKLLTQVLVHLLGNAVKFTEGGTVRLSVSRAPGRDGGVAVQFSVSDTGPGIPADRLGAIFDSFTQANNSTTREHGGAGLGLTISKRIVHMMGGRIWAESSVGLGSTFHFTAVFGNASDTETLRADLLCRDEDRGAPSDLPPLPASSILMLEDSRYNAFVIETYLKDTPCRLTVAENAEKGLELFRQGGFDLVLMDIQMPGMDGCDATRTIRQWETRQGLPATPVVALTAYVLDSDVKQCLLAGINHHLAKPVKKSALYDIITKFVRSGQ